MAQLIESVAGRFSELLPIARGGHSDISQAYDNVLGRRIAIKQLRLDRLSSDESEAILSEAKNWAQVNDPNVVSVFDVVLFEGRPTILMEYVEGDSLRIASIDRGWGLIERISVLRQLARALLALDQAGITHGDVRLDNVLVTPAGDVKLTDFGLSSAGTTAPADQSGDILALAPLILELVPKSMRSPLFDHLVATVEGGEELQVIVTELDSVYDQARQVETQDAPPTTRKTGKYWMAGALIVPELFVATLVRPGFSDNSAKRVFLEPVRISADDGLTAALSDSVSIVVDSALQQSILSASDLTLAEDTPLPPNWDELRDAYPDARLGTAIRLTPQVECAGVRCTLQLRIYELDSDNTLRLAHGSELTPFLADGSRQLYELTQYLFESSPISTDLAEASESPTVDQLLLYASLYEQAHLAGQNCGELIVEIEALSRELPGFTPLYELAIHCGLEIFYETGDADVAKSQARELSELLAMRPGLSPSLYGPLINVAIESQDYESVERYLLRARDAGADWWSLKLWRADLDRERGKHEEAEAAYGELIDTFPSRLVFINASLNYYYWGRLEEGKDLVAYSLTLFPSDAKSLNLLGMMELNTGGFTEAIANFETAYSLSEREDYLINLGLAYLLSSQAAEAEQVFRPLYENGNRDPTLLLNLADALSLQSRTEEASFFYEALARKSIDGGYTYGLISKIQALAHLGAGTEAIALLNDTRDSLGAKAEVLYAAATAYAILGYEAAAFASINEAVQAGYHPAWFSFPWFIDLCGPDHVFSEENVSSFCKSITDKAMSY